MIPTFLFVDEAIKQSMCEICHEGKREHRLDDLEVCDGCFTKSINHA